MGGTTAEAWTPRDTLETDPELNIILKHGLTIIMMRNGLKKNMKNL